MSEEISSMEQLKTTTTQTNLESDFFADLKQRLRFGGWHSIKKTPQSGPVDIERTTRGALGEAFAT